MTIPERTDTPPTDHTHEPEAVDSEQVVYCTVHPNVATNLRCNRCGRPMCTRCAVKTPVGYRCKECVREQQNKFFDAQMIDYIIAGATTLVLSFVAAAILARLGFGLGFFSIFLMFFITPTIGGAIGRIAFRFIGKRRGRHVPTAVGVCFVLGALPWLLVNPFAIGIYLFLGTSAAVGQFGIRLST